MIQHILPSGQLLPPPVRWLQRPSLLVAEGGPCVRPSSRTASAAASRSGAVELGVGRPPHPSGPPSNLAESGKARGLRTGDPEGKRTASGDGGCTSPSPGGGPGGESFGLKKNKKSRQEVVLSASGSQEGMESHGRTNTGPHSSPSLASRQQWAVRERHQRPYSRTLCQTVEPGKCCTAHSDLSLVRHGPGSCVSPRCPTAGTSVVPQVPLV